MTEVRDAASLHPQTVTDYSTGAVDSFYRPRLRGGTTPVARRQVHPRVWSEALNLAYGEAARIEVLSEHEVIVHNNRKWRA